MSQVRSPFMRLLERTSGISSSSVSVLEQIFSDFRAEIIRPTEDIRMLWAELADGITRTEQSRPSLFDGMTDVDRQALFTRATVHEFAKGELIKLGKERRRGLGVILRGRLGVGIPVSNGHHWVEILESGDVFGELKLPPQEGRAADLVSVDPCALAFLPENIVERLERNNPKLGMKLARNLLAVLRQRVDDMHRLAAERIQEHRTSEFVLESKAVAI